MSARSPITDGLPRYCITLRRDNRELFDALRDALAGAEVITAHLYGDDDSVRAAIAAAAAQGRSDELIAEILGWYRMLLSHDTKRRVARYLKKWAFNRRKSGINL